MAKNIVHPANFIDLAGKQFGRLTVVKYAGLRKTQSRATATWLCLCDCGQQIIVDGSNLKSGNQRSCKCLRKELTADRNRTHGYTGTPEYDAWLAMRKRCELPTNPSYRNYGARGISVCTRWKQSFEHFLADMGFRLSAKHSLDRINNNGNYEPGNCRWATSKEQTRNMRSNRYLVFRGQKLTLAEWAEKMNIGSDTLTCRLKKGWSLEKALLTPVRPMKRWR